MESLLKTLWRRLRFYLIDWGIMRGGEFSTSRQRYAPAALEREKEAELIARMDEGDESVRGTLIEHNLRLVAYIARGLKIPASTSKTSSPSVRSGSSRQ